ncbi:MAG: hypothetical protein H6707_10930 [Deltaproteobacteria bacterium]|nr:hypothetical protein [Deltaproteobacteria bacterium]
MKHAMKYHYTQPRALGICATCNHVSTCAHRRASETAVWYCNEFDHGITEPWAASPRTHGVAPATDELPTTALRGLCGTCENQTTCRLPKGEGGVWRCEEFR